MGLVETCLRPPVGGSWWMVDGGWSEGHHEGPLYIKIDQKALFGV